MQEQKFKLSLIAYFATVVAWAIPIWAINFLTSNTPTSSDIEKNWLPLLVILGALVSPSLIVTWSFIVETTTSFSTDGISRLTLFGKKHINWSEINSLQTGIFYIDIKTSTKIYRIPLLMYKDTSTLVKFIGKQVTPYSMEN